jgi:excisionase family DNA binding protein
MDSAASWQTVPMATTTRSGGGLPRFLQLADVAEVLNISVNQVYALVRRGDLLAVKIGGRGQWRVEVDQLEAYIARLYEQTHEFIHAHPFGEDEEPGDAEL